MSRAAANILGNVDAYNFRAELRDDSRVQPVPVAISAIRSPRTGQSRVTQCQ
jgi:hypothetical protein